MKYEQVVTHFGSVAAAAWALKVSVKTIYSWKYGKRVPNGRAYQIQILTGGALKAKG